MIKLAKRNGLLVSLVVIEEHFAKELGLQQWKCSCGASFLTFYYCAYHVEKQHPGEKPQDRISAIENTKYNKKVWEIFYSNVSDNINETIGKNSSAGNIAPSISRSVSECSTQTVNQTTDLQQNEETTFTGAKSKLDEPRPRKRSPSSDVEIIEVKRAREDAPIITVENAEESETVQPIQNDAQSSSNQDTVIPALESVIVRSNQDCTASAFEQVIVPEAPATLEPPINTTQYTAAEVFKRSPQKGPVVPTISLKLPTQLKVKPAKPGTKSPETTSKRKKKKSKTDKKQDQNRVTQPKTSLSNGSSVSNPTTSEKKNPNSQLIEPLSLPSPSYYDPIEEDMPPARFAARPRSKNLEGRTTPKKSRTMRRPAVESDSESQEDLQVVREIPYNIDVTEKIGMELRKDPSEAEEQIVEEALEQNLESEALREEQTSSKNPVAASNEQPDELAVKRKSKPIQHIASTKSAHVAMEDPRLTGSKAAWSIYQTGHPLKDNFETFQCYFDMLNEQTMTPEGYQENMEQDSTTQEQHNGNMSHTNTPSDADMCSTSASAVASPSELPVAVPPPPSEPYDQYNQYDAENYPEYSGAYEYDQYVPPMIYGRSMMIPHPEYFPYPDFKLLFTAESLFYPDGSPTKLQLNKWENFYVNAWKQQLDPYEAHERWMKKFAPQISQKQPEQQSAMLREVQEKIRETMAKNL